jgi:hypothetical protein
VGLSAAAVTAAKVVIIAGLFLGMCEAARHRGAPAHSDEEGDVIAIRPSAAPDSAIEEATENTPFSSPLGVYIAKRTPWGAVLDRTSRSGRWDAKCRIHRPSCDTQPARLPACPKARAAVPWSTLERSLPPGSVSFESRVVTVRGHLTAGIGIESTQIGCRGPCTTPAPCPAYCCNTTSSRVLLTDGTVALALSGFRCGGDDSRLCCNAPAYGQSVVATGELSRAFSMGAYVQWQLEDPELCQPAVGDEHGG